MIGTKTKVQYGSPSDWYDGAPKSVPTIVNDGLGRVDFNRFHELTGPLYRTTFVSEEIICYLDRRSSLLMVSWSKNEYDAPRADSVSSEWGGVLHPLQARCISRDPEGKF